MISAEKSLLAQTPEPSPEEPSTEKLSRQRLRSQLREEAQEFVTARFVLSRRERRQVAREIARLAHLDPTAEILVQVDNESL